MTALTPPDREIGMAQRAARAYRNHPKLRGAVEGLGSFVPLLTGVNTYLIERLNQLERERVEALFGSLDESGAELTSELIESDDFLHRFTITVRAARRTHQREKIRLFARLLAAAESNQQDGIIDTDDYEELLSTVEDLSGREFQILATIERHERRIAELAAVDGRPPDEGELWPTLIVAIERLPTVHQGEATALLARLNRTGLYSSMVGSYANMEGRGNLTPRWYRLRDLTADADGNLTMCSEEGQTN